MQEPRKSTLLFVQDAAAEPAALGAFAAEQPALALVTADGLDEAERKLAQLDPALVVWQCDAPGLPALPATAPVISTGTISPLSSEIVVPVSTSWME